MIYIYTIYKVTNKITGKSYIGQTARTVKERFVEHCSSGNNTMLHTNIKLYGKKNFEVSILEQNIESRNLADEKERFYIEQENTLFPNGYNKATGGVKGHDLNEYSRNKLSESGKGILNSRCNKYILQYDLNGNFINKYGSAKEAIRVLYGYDDRNKARTILHCLNNKYKTSHGFIWKYEE